MDAFIISSLPLRIDEEIPSAGSLRSTGVTQLHSYYGPIRHPHASAPLPGVAGYRNGLPPGISPRGVEGFSSCFTCPCHRATAVYPAGVDSRIGQIRQPMLPSPKLRKLGLRISSISGPHYVHICCGPVTRSPLLRAALSMGFRCLVSRTPAIQATGVWLLPRQALLSC